MSAAPLERGRGGIDAGREGNGNREGAVLSYHNGRYSTPWVAASFPSTDPQSLETRPAASSRAPKFLAPGGQYTEETPQGNPCGVQDFFIPVL